MKSSHLPISIANERQRNKNVFGCIFIPANRHGICTILERRWLRDERKYMERTVEERVRERERHRCTEIFLSIFTVRSKTTKTTMSSTSSSSTTQNIELDRRTDIISIESVLYYIWQPTQRNSDVARKRQRNKTFSSK